MNIIQEITERMEPEASALSCQGVEWSYSELVEETRIVSAAVVLAAGAETTGDALAAFVADRLAGYKRPKRFVLVESVPRNAMGKVDGARLKGLFQGWR